MGVTLMMYFKRSFVSLVVVFLVLTGAFLWTHGARSDDIYSAISKNLPVLGLIYKEVSANYVDQIDAERFLKAGIDGMLNTLDPYTVYFDRDDDHQIRVLTQGKYGGVGMPLNLRNNVVTVVEPPFLGTPAARVGIREGDMIIKVNGEDTEKLGLDEAARRIRGPIGSEVTLTIRRQGEPELLEFTLVREQIKIDDVRYAGYIRDGIGYIRLTRFSKNAGPEVSEAIRQLGQQNLEGLILDLRSNPGGMLEAAVEISDLFLPKGATIVSTKGRSEGSMREEKSRQMPIYGDGPLIVLVNRFSASASEIVAGAIQDHDRGLVLGDTTFGKGLVQSLIPLSQTAALKITTAKYYTPSGRCIQKRDYSSWSDSSSTENTLAYSTRLGRIVKGGGGIAPDINITSPRIGDLAWDMRRKSLFFNFAVHYANTHAALDSNIVVDDAIMKEFRDYLKTKSFEYRHPIESQLDDLKTESLEAGYGEPLLEDIDRLKQALESAKETMLASSESEIKLFLRRELASKFYGLSREVEVGLEDDPVVSRALEILSDRQSYSSILEE